MKRIVQLLFISFLVASSAIAQSNEIGNASYLRKLTGFLAGRQPTVQEYQALEKAEKNPEELAQFFSLSIDKLMASSEFAEKMTYNLSELFQIKAPTRKASYKDAMTNLFYRIALDNLSWDQLLTSGRFESDGYEVKGQSGGYGGEEYRNKISTDDRNRLNQDRLFLAPLKQYKVDDSVFNSTEAISIPKIIDDFTGDDRFAGAITTSRFLARYGNTALNKNRRRAAAIFRIFLCDPMAAAIPDQSDNLDSILDQVFPNKGKTEEQLKEELKSSGNALHGTQADCMACHYKLDPAGRTLLRVGPLFGTAKNAGALAFKRKTGELVNQPVSSIGDLGKTIAKQPEYLSCQVNHFWNWFVGRDVKMTEQRASELYQLFEKNGRRPRPLVKALVTSAEFKAKSENSNPLKSLALQAKAILVRCDTCHNAKNGVKTEWDEEVPSLTQWPIGGTAATQEYWLRTVVSGSLDLTGKTGERSMPPKTSPWQPSVGDLKVLRSWIEAGTPNESGVRTTKEGSL
jgi:hypothetical protein